MTRKEMWLDALKKTIRDYKVYYPKKKYFIMDHCSLCCIFGTRSQFRMPACLFGHGCIHQAGDEGNNYNPCTEQKTYWSAYSKYRDYRTTSEDKRGNFYSGPIKNRCDYLEALLEHLKAQPEELFENEETLSRIPKFLDTEFVKKGEK